jgi:hypothetical protein
MFARGVTWRRADNTRVSRQGALGGWDVFRQRLRGEDGKPMAYWMALPGRDPHHSGHAARRRPAGGHGQRA